MAVAIGPLPTPLGLLLPMGRGVYAPSDVLAPLAASQEALDGLYTRSAAGVTFGCPEGRPVIQIVKGLREVFPVSCWRDTHGHVLYLGFVADIHIERFGVPWDAAGQAQWAHACLDALEAHDAARWLQPEPAARPPRVHR